MYEYFWFFLIYSFLGWCLEVCFCTVDTGKLVNRGFLNGPVCPIYGFGMVAVLAALSSVQNRVWTLFLGGMVLASALELAGGWILKKLFHTTWWDYSDQPFNLGGYICLKFSLAWGVCIVAVMRGIQPLVYRVVTMLDSTPGRALSVVVGVALLCDVVVTVQALVRLDRDLGAISDVARLLRDGSDAVSERLGTAALKVDAQMDERKPAAQARLDIARAEMLDHRNYVARRLMRAFPEMKNHRYEAALEQFKDWMKEKKG